MPCARCRRNTPQPPLADRFANRQVTRNLECPSKPSVPPAPAGYTNPEPTTRNHSKSPLSGSDAVQALECVVKNRGIAAVGQSSLQLHPVRRCPISDADQIGRSSELKRFRRPGGHGSSFSMRTSSRSTSDGDRTTKRASVRRSCPTRTVIWFGRTAKASSSVPSFPT